MSDKTRCFEITSQLTVRKEMGCNYNGMSLISLQVFLIPKQRVIEGNSAHYHQLIVSLFANPIFLPCLTSSYYSSVDQLIFAHSKDAFKSMAN